MRGSLAAGHLEMLTLIDAHCHLQDERLGEDRIDSVVAEALQSGILQMACNGCWQDDWARVAELAARYPIAVIPNFGLHPWWLHSRSPDWLDRLRRMLLDHPHAGLGECGLDRGPRATAGNDPDLQLKLFEQQLTLAEQLGRTVSVHCVRAYGAVHDVLRRRQLSVPVVLHSWTGAEQMTASLAHSLPNVYFSLSGHLTRLPPAKALAMVRACPLDRLLLESDSPDGTLQLSEPWLQALPSLQGLPAQLEQAGLQQINRPCVLVHTLQLVAAVLGRAQAEVAVATTSNALSVFGSTAAAPPHHRDGGGE